MLNRRTFLAASATSAVLAGRDPLWGADEALAKRIQLGFSLYGMKSLPIDKALAACAEIGYECVELPLLSGWPTDSAKLTDKDLENIRQLSAEHKLPIVALMENLNVLAEAEKQQENLDRLRRAGEVAQTIDPTRPPLIETILGGKPAQWEQVKERMVAGLRKWAAALEPTRTTLAIKAHVGNAAHLPEHIAWLLKEVDSPSLRAAYDFSHFQVQGRKMFETIETLVKHMAFVHVKDVRGTPEKFEFLLPGEGTIDYTSYFRTLDMSGYVGPVVVEVSGQIFGRANYNPQAAAKQSFVALDQARRQAIGI